MFQINKHCATVGNNSKPKFEEKNAVMYVLNSKQSDYTLVTIDNCDIVVGNKCDNGVHLVDTDEVLFIELKGSDVKHAVVQLEATLLSYNMKNRKNVKCFIISSNNPNSSTVNQTTKTRFKQKNGVPLFIERPKFEYFYT